jgi:hypothetical protein
MRTITLTDEQASELEFLIGVVRRDQDPSCSVVPLLDAILEQLRDPEACPSCGRRPGEGLTAGCEDAFGCGYRRTLAASLNNSE